MTDENPQKQLPELNVPALLDSSLSSDSKRKLPVIILGAFAGVALVGVFLGEKNPGLQFLTSGIILLMVVSLLAFSFYVSRKNQNEMLSLETAGESIQLREWTKAADILNRLLSSPMKSPQSRLQALAYLIHVLNRFQRYSDTIDVYDHLLDYQRIDDLSMYNLRAGRAMALLRDDRLYDADKAIGQLRQTGPENSPPLIILEMYHAMKTGRSQDLVDKYLKQRDLLKIELGPKSADAHAMAAAAFFQLGDATQAENCWRLATSITPTTELVRRFPEIKSMSQGCSPVEFPLELAS